MVTMIGDLILASFEGHSYDINHLNRNDNNAAYLVMDAGDYNIVYLHLFYDSGSFLKTMNNGTVTLKYMLEDDEDKLSLNSSLRLNEYIFYLSVTL